MQNSSHSVSHRKRTVWGAALSMGLVWGAMPASAQLVTQTLYHASRPITGLSVNDHGWSVWATGPSTTSAVYIWKGSGSAALLWNSATNKNQRSPRINNNSWVVFTAHRSDTDTTIDVFAWKGSGTPVNLSDGLGGCASPVVNNLNQVAWYANVVDDVINDVYLWKPGDATFTNLTVFDENANSTEPRLNDQGFLSWVRTAEDAQLNPASNVVLAPITDPASYTVLTDHDNIDLYNGGLNNHNAITWIEYTPDGAPITKGDIWRLDPLGINTRENLTDLSDGNSFDIYSTSPQINDDGIVIWYTKSKDLLKQELYWDIGYGAQPVPVTTPYEKSGPVAISNNGHILFSSGLSSATGYDVILARFPIISGKVALLEAQNCAVPVEMEFRLVESTKVYSRTVLLKADGSYTVSNVPPASYTLSIKGAKWLRKNILVDSSGGDVAGADASLIPGDANNDNSVDIFDLGTLANDFNSGPADPEWNGGRSDFNCDGNVDIFDLGTLATYFNTQGDE